MKRSLLLAALALLGAAAARADTSAGASKEPPSMPETLDLVACGKLPLEPLVIVYDDLHPFHGGLTLGIHGDGKVDQEARREKTGRPRKVTRADVLKLLDLVRQLKAWEQRTPDRRPVPDESRARLTIAWRERQSTIWEWYNDLHDNKRMIAIRELMKQLAWQPGSY